MDPVETLNTIFHQFVHSLRDKDPHCLVVTDQMINNMRSQVLNTILIAMSAHANHIANSIKPLDVYTKSDGTLSIDADDD